MYDLSLGCVVLAAGNAVRFGGDKLSAVLGGRTLLERALDAVPAEEFSRVVVIARAGGKPVPENTPVPELARRYGFSVLYNPRPELGISGSVRLGTAALMERCDGILFQTADQPLLRRETVRELARLWRRNPSRIAALSHRGVRGNPCVFPARFFPELLALSGDRGGSAVIRRHRSELVLLDAAAEELLDADTPSELAKLAQYL